MEPNENKLKTIYKSEKMKNFLSILALLMFASSCKEEKKLFALDATIKNIPDSTMFYLQRAGNIVDSTYIINGSLSVKSQLNQENRPEKLTLISLKPEIIYVHLLVENGEHVTFNADKKDFPWNINVSGSTHQDKAEKFNQIMYQKQEIIKELKGIHSLDKELLNKKTTQVLDSIENVTIALIKKEFNSYAALDNFKYYKTKFSNEELNSLYKKLDEDLKETIIGKGIKLQSKFPNPKQGDKYYDYSAITKNGDSLSLSEIKNKYILLHFSSLSCYGSQLALPELKELHKTFEKDLEIVSISTDINKSEWQDHVKRDSISWTYLWDGKGNYNDANVKYWLEGTPNFVLIAPDKIILEKWFGYRDGIIEEKIIKYLNSK